jgi:hypothetical protein
MFQMDRDSRYCKPFLISTTHCTVSCLLINISFISNKAKQLNKQMHNSGNGTTQNDMIPHIDNRRLLIAQTLCYHHLSKSCPATRHGGTWGEKRYSSYSFLTSALDGGEWSASRPGRALYPRGKDPRYPLDRRLGGPQSRSGHRG